jgi:4-alpha-glucanotransferase
MSQTTRQLRQLAARCGIQTAYYDVARQRQSSSTETLLRVLAAWGCPVENLADVPAALAERERQQTEHVLPPVLVAWEGDLARIPLSRLPTTGGPSPAAGRLRLNLKLETGEQLTEDVTLEPEPAASDKSLGKEFPPVAGWTRWSSTLPWGYHHLTVDGEPDSPTLVISAPQLTYHTPGKRREWGVFAPVYALHSETSWGGGTFSDLERLWDWVTRLGGSFVATLPLMAAFLDEPCDFSPYSPASRLFWNEFYIDITRIPEFSGCEEAQQRIGSDAFEEMRRDLRSRRLVDYRQQMELSRPVLKLLADHCFSQSGDRRNELDQFVASRPELDDYATFRGVMEREKATWSHWPVRQRDGELLPGDFDEPARRYHLYVQWIAQHQIQHLVDRARNSGDGLYLDMPLGVHHQGYDTWRNRDAFAMSAAGGAPPDTFFTKGQNWGFPPLHPEGLRKQGYRYWIAALRHQLRHAGMLRIDHIMQLHRLYWVPDGLDARQGAYVRYAADELHAILCLESHRHQCQLVGENLGTVPPEVNASMKRHRIDEIYVMQYQIPSQLGKRMRPVPRRSMASLNTHDMPLFAAYWQGDDLQQLHELGLLDGDELAHQHQARRDTRQNLVQLLLQAGRLSGEQPEPQEVLDALHQFLAGGAAENVLINLEDLWLETQPQNTPGTSHERANWQRKFQLSIEQIIASSDLRRRLEEIGTARLP